MEDCIIFFEECKQLLISARELFSQKQRLERGKMMSFTIKYNYEYD